MCNLYQLEKSVDAVRRLFADLQIPLDETIDSFKKLTQGDYDHIPEQAFFLCGGLDDVEANAKKLEQGS